MLKKTLRQLVVIMVVMSLLSTTVFAGTVDRSFWIFSDEDKPSNVIAFELDFYKFYESSDMIIYTKADYEGTSVETTLNEIITKVQPLYTQMTTLLGDPIDKNADDKLAFLFHDLVGANGVYNPVHSSINAYPTMFNNTDIVEIKDFYIETEDYGTNFVAALMLHEAQHAIHERIDMNESGLVNEMISVFLEDYFIPGDQDSLVDQYFASLSGNGLAINRHNYYHEFMLGTYIYNTYDGWNTLIAIRDNLNLGFPSIMQTLNVVGETQERAFFADFMHYTLTNARLYDNALRPLVLSDNNGTDLTLKGYTPSVKFLQPGVTTFDLTFVSSNANVDFVIEELSFNSIGPWSIDYTGSVNSLIVDPGTVSITMSDASNILAITPIHAVDNQTATWSYSTSVPVPNNAPVVTLNGDTTINLLLNDTYTELGATAVDTEDGNLVPVQGGDTVDTNTVGTYLVSYTATDSNSATNVKTRTVNVTAGDSPVITLIGDTTINLFVGDVYNEQGTTVVDTEDTNTLTAVASGSVNVNTVGVYTITYTVTDTHGNEVTSTRTVNVTLGNAPVITLTGDATINLLVDATYTEQGATATDAEDGNINVVITGGPVSTTTPAAITLTYTATDSHGNTSTATRTVNVTLGNAPVITLTGNATVTIAFEGTYSELGATAVDTEDGSVDVIVSGTIDNTTAGDYTITYTATDSQSNTSTATRTVTVEAEVIVVPNVAPVVTLTGSNVTLAFGATYNESGATATDSEDGNINVVITGTVNTNLAGTYTLTYTATDSGSLSHSVTRLVTVNAAPVVVTPPVVVVTPPSTGGGGGGGSTPAPFVPAPVVVPVIEEPIVVAPVIKQGKATVEAVVTEDKVEVIFSTEELDNDIKEVIVESEIATVIIPLEVIADMPEVKLEVTTDVTLTAVQKEIVGDAIVYDFNLYSADKKISTFSKAITISVPYELKEGEDASLITVFFMNDKGELENMKGEYKNGQITFDTNHFSHYFAKENKVFFTDTTDIKVLALASKGIISGKAEGLYAPEDNLTRAEVATLLVRALNLTADTTYTNKFSDVSTTHWAYDYIMIARELGLVSGTSETTYDPNASIKANDAMIMISKSMSLFKGIENNSILLEFENADTYAVSFMSHLVELDFINEDFDAGKTMINRLDMADLVHSMYFFK